MQISYLPETSLDINEDLTSRKEFLLFKQNVELIEFRDELKDIDEKKNIIPKFLISKNIPNSNYLDLTSYQMLVRNYFNLNTPYSRLLLKWLTGFGKTVGALSIAMNFIKYYQLQEKGSDNQLGSVYIIGFTQNIFKSELLKYPEFGFISREELAKLKLMRKNSHSGNNNDIEILRKYVSMLRKRFNNRKNNGFFKFIGYKELSNHLFVFDEHSSDNMRINLETMSSEELQKSIDNNTIKINKTMLKEFANSLLICDEIHNVYNTFEKNNWGIALQTILNYHDSCRALFLSATPLNNSPTEIIDLLNLLLPRRHYPVLHKKDFFTETKDEISLISSKEKEISNYLKGRISFIQDNNPQFIASKTFVGESIKGIDYLKFIRCKMSKFQYNTYKSVLKDNTSSLGQDGQYLNDFVLPDPTISKPLDNKSIGIYKPKDIKSKLSIASDAWKSKYGIYYNNTDDVIQGKILKAETLSIISNKYHEMLSILIQNLKENKGKTFIFHNYIHMTGTLFIKEILLQNKIIGEFDNSTDETLCICGKSRKDHTKDQINPLTAQNTNNKTKNKKEKNNNKKIINDDTHHYQPVRFAIVHSNLDKTQINRSLEKFNHVNNIYGSKIMILIGSRIMKEAHSLDSMRNLFVMSKPDNISMLIQIIGRLLRLGSQKLLPKNDQHVDIRLFVSSTGTSELSYEELKYMKKIKTFKVIQRIEKLMHENAIDSYFNYDTIWKNAKIDEYGLSILPYEIKKYKTIKPDDLNLSTFNAYYAKAEIQFTLGIIKRLFIEVSAVWKYDDLFNAVKNPPFTINIDSSIISKDSFNIALNNILYNTSSDKYTEPIITELVENLVESNLIDKLNNPDDKIILVINSIKYVIVHTGELYSLVPIYNDDIFIDTDIVFRTMEYSNTNYVDIIQYLKYDSSDDYMSKKARFIAKWKVTNIIDLEQSLCDFGTKFHIMFLEEIITYMFNVWTLPDQKKDENHKFYLKLIYYYDLQKLIAWAHLLDKNLTKKYSPFVTPVTLKLLKAPKMELLDIKELNLDGSQNVLISTLNRNKNEWLSSGMIKEFNTNLHESEKLFDNIYKKTTKHTKVSANLLPVGHYLENTSRFYLPNSGWFDYTTNTDNKIMKENDIVIGYDKRSKTGLSIKFKLRNPIQKIKQHADARLVEKGSTCSTKSKNYLNSLVKKLNINIQKDSSNTNELCNKIRNKLIYLELKERQKGSNIKYFYNVLDNTI